MEIYCDVCMKSIVYEGSEKRLSEWLASTGWKIVQCYCFCEEHKKRYIQYLSELKKGKL